MSAAMPVTEGLVAAYDFVQGDDPGTLYDISGNGHHGTISGGATWVDEGIAFNGIDGVVNLGTGLGSLAEHTIIVAQYENTITGHLGSVFARYNYGSKVGFTLDKHTVAGSTYPYRWRATYYDGTDPENPTRSYVDFYQRYPGWAVLHSRYDGDAVDLGFDSRPGKSKDIPVYRDTQAYDCTLGGRSGAYFNGTIGYALIYNRALSDSELETAYVAIHDEMAARGVDDLPGPRVKFDPPMLIMTFDDSLATEYTNGLPIAAARNFPCTSYTVSRLIGTSYGGQRLTWEQLHEMRVAGWGVEDHTYNHHIPITDFTDAELIQDLQNTDAAFIAAGLPAPEHIAYPGIAANTRTATIIQDFRATGRGFTKYQNTDILSVIEWDEPQYWDDPLGWYRIDQVGMAGDVLSENVVSAIDRAADEGTALFLYTHGVSDDGSDTSLSKQAFTDLIDYTLAKGFDPITVDGFYRAMQGIRTRPATGQMTLHGETTRATYNSTVDYVGFVWGTTRHNNPEGTAPDASGYDQHWISASGDYKEDEFSYVVASYTPGIEYYYRSAARIDGTWYYGEELTYTNHDTVSGTNGRYQAVTGTVAYDDVNKRMNVTTATGANGKASGRLKSYKFTEGSQIYDVTLPTGADGDFITLVTHSANGLMTDGIGVGLQSDGAGNWNLATLSGTTVTEGADSGLDDGDVARIEIEKDVTGAYWYYIYDASGTKPTTATGKLFTTLTEGYTGWYANGAGAETQTYAIDNISIRAESIVGRTNVELTEEVFNSVTGQMETRTYFKPIHRGAMLETYHDGTQEVVGTTFVDDCQWNRLSECVFSTGKYTHDSANGKYISSGSYQALWFDGMWGAGIYEVVSGSECNRFTTLLAFGSQEKRLDTAYTTPCYKVVRHYNDLIFAFGNPSNAEKVIAMVYNVFAGMTSCKIKVDWRENGNILIYIADVNSNYPQTPQVNITDTHYTSGYCGISGGNVALNPGATWIESIHIIAASPDATNGIAAYIPPIGGGARYGVEESVYNTFTTANVDKGVYLTSAKVKTTNPNADEVSLEYVNETTSTTLDNTSIVVDADYTIKTTPITIKENETDVLTVGVKNSTTCNQPATYVESLSLIPVSGNSVLYPQDLAFISGVKPSQKRKVEVK